MKYCSFKKKKKKKTVHFYYKYNVTNNDYISEKFFKKIMKIKSVKNYFYTISYLSVVNCTRKKLSYQTPHRVKSHKSQCARFYRTPCRYNILNQYTEIVIRIDGEI